ncbi:MAG TPA: hypothetical protein VEC15_01695, partial [Actinomycetota bacterium]|nr:hypothetical protein [Actinomycetota bacterium]
ASDAVDAQAHARHVHGLLEPDAGRAVDLLRDAADAYERLEMAVFAARAMVDAAWATARHGIGDPRPLLERARERLIACDAKLFLREVDDETAALA